MLRIITCLLGLTFSLGSMAEMTAEQRCAREGEVAARAGELRNNDTDKESALAALRAEYLQTDSGLTEQSILGMTNFAYMTKMSPDKLRAYAEDQCQQNILR
jgi:hypothetical protein